MPRWTCAAVLLVTACVRSAPREERMAEPPTAECAELPAERDVPHLPDGGLDEAAAADAGFGWMDKEDIRRTARAHLGEVHSCSDQLEVRGTPFIGRIAVRFVIGNEGDVCAARIAEAKPSQPLLEQCLVQAARGWRFPRPNGPGSVTVTYPFVFGAP
nr:MULTISPECIES: AgmX/PglI C-terminal domain-containing protein [Myxococcaceae]